MIGNVFLNAARKQLFYSELHSPLLNIDFEHLRLDRLPNFQNVLRMIDTLLGAHVADVNHALDALGKLHERPDLSQARDWPFDHRAHRKLLRYISPRIAQRLLQAQSDTAISKAYAQNHDLDRASCLDHVAGCPHSLSPRHLRNVD